MQIDGNDLSHEEEPKKKESNLCTNEFPKVNTRWTIMQEKHFTQSKIK
jgi:hypothetical protein